MSNTLRDAAESTVQTVSDFVHDTFERLDELALPHHRARRSWPRWAMVAGVCIAGIAALAWVRRRRTQQATTDRNSAVDTTNQEHLHESADVAAHAQGKGDTTTPRVA